MGLDANFTIGKVASSANSCANCHCIYQDTWGWGGGGLHVSKEREMKKERGADTSFHIMAKLGLPRFNLGKD